MGWSGGCLPTAAAPKAGSGGLLPVGSSRLAGFNEAGSVLLVGTLGAAGGRARKGRERGPVPTPGGETSGWSIGRLVSRQDSVGSVLNCGFSPAPGRAFQAWGRGRLVSGLHSSVASGRPGPAGAQEPHSAIMGQWPSVPGPRGQEPQGLWESPGGACFHHHPRHLDGVLGGSVGAEDS